MKMSAWHDAEMNGRTADKQPARDRVNVFLLEHIPRDREWEHACLSGSRWTAERTLAKERPGCRFSSFEGDRKFFRKAKQLFLREAPGKYPLRHNEKDNCFRNDRSNLYIGKEMLESIFYANGYYEDCNDRINSLWWDGMSTITSPNFLTGLNLLAGGEWIPIHKKRSDWMGQDKVPFVLTLFKGRERAELGVQRRLKHLKNPRIQIIKALIRAWSGDYLDLEVVDYFTHVSQTAPMLYICGILTRCSTGTARARRAWRTQRCQHLGYAAGGYPLKDDKHDPVPYSERCEEFWDDVVEIL